MGDPRHDLGLAAEERVARWLADCGWSILARRVRSPDGGEVDIVAVDPRGTLVAVEVRARRTARMGTGSEAIDPRRTARIGRTLATYGARHAARHGGLRIDLVTLSPEPGARWRIRRIPDIGAW